jgi:hypothetical protein
MKVHRWNDAPPAIRLLTRVLLPGIASSVLAYYLTSNPALGLLVLLMVLSATLLVEAATRRHRAAYRLGSAAADVGIDSIEQSQAASIHGLTSALSGARDIRILAIRGLGLFALTDSVLRDALLENQLRVKCRILMLLPTSTHVAARASELGEDAETLRQGILLATRAVDELRALNISVELRFYDRLPVFRLLLIDRTAFVSAYLPYTEGHDSTTLTLDGFRRQSLYDVFDRVFEEQWGAASPVTHQLPPPDADAIERIAEERASTGRRRYLHRLLLRAISDRREPQKKLP